MRVSDFNLDLSSFFQFIFTAAALLFALLYLVKKTASKYFAVDANFDDHTTTSQMIAVADGQDRCAVCDGNGSKKCSRCKAVRYCSASCQAKDWNAGHKSKCKELKFELKFLESISQTSDSSWGKKTSIYGSKSGTELQQLKKVLFPYEEFVLLFNWEKQGFPPCGLLNCGNSCFANVVLQCLSCTRPLIAYLLEKGHKRECKRNDWCFLCELQSHVERARLCQPFSPINILSRLPNIGGNLGYGKQEDAHEFMRFAIDRMQSVCLDEYGGEKVLHSTSQETTLIQYTFGGHLQSQVTCSKCNKISYRYENMMDLTVEIQGEAGSLEECLDQFTAEEWLDGENMYKCDGCNDYVKACKRLAVRQAPNILTIALKRFQSGRYGKLNKRVTFPEILDLGPYMSEPGNGTDIYQLYAVVVHVDMLNASFFGHYICYTKDIRGNWYRVDDCKVTPAELEEVLAQGAYMLLYSRMRARPSCLNSLQIANAEDTHPVEVVKLAQPYSEQSDESIALEASNGSAMLGTVVSDVQSFSEESHSKEEDPVGMDLDDPFKVDLAITRDVDLESNSHVPVKVNSRSQDVNMDIDELTDVDLMPTRGEQLDPCVENPFSNFLGSKDFHGHESEQSHSSGVASSCAENSHFRMPNLASLDEEVIPSNKAHNLEIEVLEQGSVDNKVYIPSELAVNACLSSHSNIKEIASCKLPLNSVTTILHEGNPTSFGSLPNPMLEWDGNPVKALPGGKIAHVRPAEINLSPNVNKLGVLRENIRDINVCSNLIDKQPGKCLSRGERINGEGDDCYSGIHESQIDPDNLHGVPSSDMNCTLANGDGPLTICNKEAAPPECNGFPSIQNDYDDQISSEDPVSVSSSDKEMVECNGLFPTQNNCDNQESSRDSVTVSISDTEMQYESNLLSVQGRQHPGLEQVASCESGKGYPMCQASEVISSKATGNSSCSKTVLNPLFSAGFLIKRATQKSYNRNRNSRKEPVIVGNVCQGSKSNGFDNFVGVEQNGHNGNGKPVNGYENKTYNTNCVEGTTCGEQKGLFSRGFLLDKPLRKRPHKEDGRNGSKDLEQ